MATRDEIQKRLLATFRVEAEEHLKLMTAGLIELERTPSFERQLTIVENVFREAHSLKGAARSVRMSEVETLCQSLETVFAAWKREELGPSPELYDTLHRAIDILARLSAASHDDRATTLKDQIGQLDERLAELLQECSSKQRTKNEQADPIAFPSEAGLSAAEEKQAPTETVRITTAKLDAVLLQAEELLSVKLATSQHAAELKEINSALSRWKKEWAKFQPEVRAITRNLEKNFQDGAERKGLAKIAEFLDWNLQAFTELDDQLTALRRSADQDRRALGAMVDELLTDMKNVLMLSFSSVLDTLPRLVRGLSRDQAKEVDLVIEGGEVEVDRRILEEMKDPLIHLIRNCIDHGIEKPEE
ncbi:MAG TPA: Hpt domain-containing protein, partial [Candidatus Binatia bacterium]